ncbi:ATP-binding cassette domain-containing protein, partial [Mycobacterium tuberculosis]|nr:ATP-binding cassette domain-containing protein [Mycobacterium tuberculosis]
MAAALDIVALEKSFGRPAVDKLTLSVPPGTFYALLGPNGAGKTTTLRIVAGLLGADAGRVAIHGIDIAANPVAAKAVTAWVPDEPLVYDKLTPTEYLGFVAGLWRVPTATARRAGGALLDRLGLGPHAHERCEAFSKGMRQKVALAGALIHDIDLAAAAAGQELRLYPSTWKTATIGGFVAGGAGGIGSVKWGGLRTPGTTRAVRIVTLEAHPRVLTLTGDAIAPVAHAYGVNGVITEVEIALAPRVAWVEVMLGLDSFAAAATFA